MFETLSNILAPDLLFAIVLVGIALFVFFAVRVGALPVKGVPFVVGTLLAAIGIGVWRERRTRDLLKVLEGREAELRKREAQLAILKSDYDLAAQETEAALAKRNAEIVRLMDEIARIRARRDEELERYDAMTPAERRDYVFGIGQ